MAFLQDLRRQGKPPRQAKPETFSTALIPRKLRRHLFARPQPEGKGATRGLDVDRYEFLVYRLLPWKPGTCTSRTAPNTGVSRTIWSARPAGGIPKRSCAKSARRC
ncbi:hypothetical protein [Methylomagnum sp.]